MKCLLSLFFILHIIYCESQLELNQSQKKSWTNCKMPTQLYFESNRSQCYRSLVSNEDFLNTPLNERANEISSPLWSFGLGMESCLKTWLKLEAGMNYLQNGEAYKYISSINDSTFNYISHYRYIGMPIALNYHYGNKFSLYGGLGINPLLYSSYIQKRNWTNALGKKGEDEIKLENQEFSSFVIQFYAQIGFQYIGQDGWGIFSKAVYRQQVTNSYSKTNDFIHKANGIGISFGLTKTLL